MIADKIVILIKKLIEKTNRKEAIWNNTSRENEFKLNLEDSSIITDSWTHEFEEFVDFKILNKNGKIVYSILLHHDDENFDLVRKLNEMARSSYYKIDDTIDEILKKTDSDEIIGSNDQEDVDKLPW